MDQLNDAPSGETLMQLDARRVTELKGLLTTARQREINFGLCLGGRPEDTAIMLHKIKAPESLGRAAKAEAGTSRMVFGTLSVDGGVLTLRCQGDPVPGSAKHTRTLLKSMKLNLKVRVMDAAGGLVADPDGADEDGAPDAEPDAEEDGSAAEWAALQAALEPRVLAFLSRGTGDVSRVKAAWATATEAAEEGDHPGAVRIGHNVERILAAAAEARADVTPAPDASAAKWLLASRQIAPHVETVLQKGTGQPDRIRAVWAFAQGKAEAQDYAGALKSLGPLAQLITEARAGGSTPAQDAAQTVDVDRTRIELLAANWKAASGRIEARLAEVLRTKPVARTRMEAVWALANEKAERGAETSGEAEYALALRALADLKKLLDDAVPEVPPQGGVGAATGALAAEGALTSARTLLAANVGTANTVLERLRKEFGPALPPTLDEQATTVEALFAAPSDTDPALVETAARRLADEIVALEQRAIPLRAARAAWTQDLSVFEVRLLTLDNHPLRSEAGTVGPLLDGIRADLQKARQKADRFDWADASAALKLLLPRCDAAEATADALSHYYAVRAERVARLAVLPAPGGVAQDQPRKAVEAAITLRTDADAEKAAGRFAEAVALLNQIPAAVDRAVKLIATAGQYDAQYGQYENRVVGLAAFTGVAATAIASGLADFGAKVAAAKVDATGDYALSMTLLGQAYPHYTSLKARAEQARAYAAELLAFAPRLAAVKDHPGRIAIEAFYARLQADQQFAADRAAQGEFEIGARTLKAGEPLQADQIARAAIARDYKAAHAAVDKALDKVEHAANGAKAAAGVAEARRRIGAAEAAAASQDWPGALAMIGQARTTVQDAQALLDDDKALGDLKDGAKLDAIATHVPAALGVYEAMRNHVAGKDAGGTFAARLAKAEAPAQRARDEVAKTGPGLAPDFAKARADLDQAIALCEDTLALIARKGPFDAALAGLKTQHAATLPGKNQDDVILHRLAELDDHIKRAEAAARPQVFDFDAAQQHIAAGLLTVRVAEREAEAYVRMKPDVARIQTALTFIKHPARAPGLAAEIMRLEDAGTAINADVTAARLPEAARRAAEAGKLCDGFERLAQDYQAAIGLRQSWVTSRLPTIQGPGRAACDIERRDAEALDAQIQAMFDRHVYKAVSAHAGKAYWVISAGQAILAAAQLYEPSRALAEAALTAALPDRNPATEDRYDALRDQYDAAVALAGERNFGRATTMTDAVPAGLAKLAGDAQAYRDYDAARQQAGARLGEAMRSKQAAAIKPLLEHLRSRHGAALKLVAAGNHAGATKLLQEMVTGAEAAIVAGNEYGAYAQTAQALKKAPAEGGKALANAIQEVEALYDELMARPEAGYAVATLAGINKVIALARQAGRPEAEARGDLGKAVDACARARLELGHYTQMETEISAIEAAITAVLSTHAQADFVTEAMQALRGDLAAARRNARGTGTYVEASRVIETVDAEVLALTRAADAQLAYVADRAVVEPELERMEKHPNRYAVTAEINACRKAMTEAAGKAAAHDHAAAAALLQQAKDAAAAGLLKAKMHANQEPTADEVKAIIQGPKGAERLDTIIATLGPEAKRKVLTAAFEARFGCRLELYKTKADETGNVPDVSPNKKDPDIRRFYDVMCELPDTHTKDNDSMQVFMHVGEARGSDYSAPSRKVAMREGEAGQSSVYGVGMSHEIEAVEPGCELVPGEDATYFDWNTIHEVGHAVDDRLGFMARRGAALAGWTDYRGNVLPVAERVAAEFGFDAAYVASYMAGAAPAVPEPAGVDAEQWERRRVACTVWVDRARTGKQPWQTAAAAKATAIGGICYQESYDGHWTSYPLAERSRGVTGYQFRAPGEWFSELYSAYHTGKLKPSHPAVSWLSAL